MFNILQSIFGGKKHSSKLKNRKPDNVSRTDPSKRKSNPHIGTTRNIARSERHFNASQVHRSSSQEYKTRPAASINTIHSEEVFISDSATRETESRPQTTRNNAKREVIERIFIQDGSTGNSYRSLFEKYMDSSVKEILIEDTYIREHFQIQNLIMFLELSLKMCNFLKTVKLKTAPAPTESALDQQKSAFRSIAVDLRKRGITFKVEFSKSMHDREIFFSNGYILSIGRGLDFYKPLNSRYSLGMMDYDYRICRETKIDVFKC